MAQTANYGFEKPSTDKNVDEEFYQLQETLDLLDSILAALQTAVNGKAAVSHTHTISQIVNLAAELAAKMPANQTFKLDDLTDVSGADGAPNNYVLVKSALGWLPSSALAALGPHGHLISEITGLVDALAEKADAAPTAAALDNRLRFDAAQSKTMAERGQARANIDVGVLAGFRNKIINPSVDVAQRNTSFSVAPGATTYTADRLIVENTTNQTATVTINKPNLSVLSLVQNPSWLGVGFSVAPTNGSVSIRQPIEDVRTLAGKRATFGAMVSGSGGTGGALIGARLLQIFGIGGSASVSTDIPLNVTTVPAVASYVEGVVDTPPVSGKVLGSANDFLMPEITYSPRTTETTVFSLFYLVEGDCRQETDKINLVAPRHPQQELALCQRYYEKVSIGFGGYQAGGGSIYAPVFYKQQKRIVPTVSTVQAPTSANVSSYSFDNVTAGGARVVATATASGTAALVGWIAAVDAEF